MNLVSPPSTSTSYAASAISRPDCGRAAGWLSILTPMTLRSWVPSSPGRPLIVGSIPGASVVVVVDVVVVVGADVVVVSTDVDVVESAVSPDEHAAATVASATATIRVLR